MIQRVCIDDACIFFNHQVGKGCIKTKVGTNRMGACTTREYSKHKYLDDAQYFRDENTTP